MIVSPRRSIIVGPAALAIIGIGALLVLFALRAFHERHMILDDGYILGRYASHLADGHGFRWNVSSAPAEGFTSVIFVVLQACLLRVGFELPGAAALLSIAAIAGVAAFLVAAADPRRPGFAVAAMPAAFLLLDPRIGVHASRGLETSVFFLAAVGMVSVTGTMVRQPRRTTSYLMALASVLLVLARPDGALIVWVCWVAAARALGRGGDQRAVLLPGAAALLMTGGVLAAWKFWYFGELLPTAYYVKAAGVGWAGMPDVRAFVAEYWVWLLAGGVAFMGAVLAPGRGHAPSRPVQSETVIGVAVTALWLIYAMRIVHEMGFEHRFTFVLVPLAALAITRGLRATLDRVVERWPSSTGLLTGAGYLVVIAIALASAHPVSRSLTVLRSEPPSDPFANVLTRLGRAISNAGLGEQISFLNGAAGAAPFFAGAKHTDAMGLASPEFSKVTSIERRQQLIAEGAFDIIEMPFLPASAGATSEIDDPLRNTAYWRHVESIGLAYLRFKTVRDMPEWLRLVHWHMRYLRDHMTLAGAMQAPGVQMNVYVSRASPHFNHLIGTLSRGLDISATEAARLGNAR